MAKKGEHKVMQDVYDALENFFIGKISGGLYQKGCRPANSILEDAVISSAKGTGDQIQQGTIKLNIYVPSIDNGTGRSVPNIGRLQDIEELNESIFETLNSHDSDYEFWQGMSPNSIEEPISNQYFVNFDIKFKRITF